MQSRACFETVCNSVKCFVSVCNVTAASFWYAKLPTYTRTDSYSRVVESSVGQSLHLRVDAASKVCEGDAEGDTEGAAEGVACDESEAGEEEEAADDEQGQPHEGGLLRRGGTVRCRRSSLSHCIPK